ncbi:hypothetical protein HOLleu_02746 [Holothuria leucospilota]|uniref:Uncharacterized protein n=1 Tax=Holothuria leucospilota TaxID=206669 RepID=A0A9Q1HL18_HOLLE|nr:hypothetical protein HOLleu_02746 [Holothuria leucospilota]
MGSVRKGESPPNLQGNCLQEVYLQEQGCPPQQGDPSQHKNPTQQVCPAEQDCPPEQGCPRQQEWTKEQENPSEKERTTGKEYPAEQGYLPEQECPTKQGYPPEKECPTDKGYLLEPGCSSQLEYPPQSPPPAYDEKQPVQSRFKSGDYDGAEESSKSAKSWSMGGLLCGVITWVLAVIVPILYVVVVLDSPGKSFRFGHGHDTFSGDNNIKDISEIYYLLPESEEFHWDDWLDWSFPFDY